MPKLVYHDSDGVDKTLTLSNAPVTVGRASDCEVRTHDAMVSRKHASITWDGSGYFIEDLGSSNGVFLGTEKVQRAPFRPGDVVTCGSLVLRMLPTAAREPTPEVRVTAATARGLEIDHAALDAGMENSALRTNEKQARVDSEAVRLKNDLRRETERREQAEAALLAAEKKSGGGRRRLARGHPAASSHRTARGEGPQARSRGHRRSGRRLQRRARAIEDHAACVRRRVRVAHGAGAIGAARA